MFGDDKPQPLPAIGTPPPPPPMFGADVSLKKRPGAKSMQPSFLGTGSAPTQGQLGQKTLLGN